MYEKEIQELKKIIKNKEAKIAQVNEDIKIKSIAIAVLLVVSTLLGIWIGPLIGHPLAVPVGFLSLATFGVSAIYENGIKGDKSVIASAKLKIKECNDDIKRYEKAQGKGLEKEASLESKESYSYSYDRDKSPITYDDMDRMIDFFKNETEKQKEKKETHRKK